MNRYGEIIFEAEKGINFEVLEENGKLRIKAVFCSENYSDPPIPKGYEYFEGNLDNGFVIRRIHDGSEFVWIPTGILDPDGTIDDKMWNEKFGKRKEYANPYIIFFEPLADLVKQIGCVNKYGGFYISRYNISKVEGKPQSKKGFMPWVDINLDEAQKVASSFEKSEVVSSHLTLASEYDSVLAWFIKSKAKTSKEIEFSEKWGNYKNSQNSFNTVAKTGSCEQWCVNNIYDFAGNVAEWTQENCGDFNYVSRGDGYYSSEKQYSVSRRNIRSHTYISNDLGFRIVLCIK